MSAGSSTSESLSSTSESADDGWSLEDGLTPKAALTAEAPIEPLPFPLTLRCKNYSEQILAWVQSEIASYDIPIAGTQSFCFGLPFVALVHKIDPSLLDYEKFDRTDPIKTLTTVFGIAEVGLGIPNLLDPKDVLENRDTRALLLYISLFKVKMTEMAKSTIVEAQQSISKLALMVADCMESVQQKENQFRRDRAALECLGLDQKNIQDEKTYNVTKESLMNAMVDEAIGMVDSLDQKNDLLAEENQLLQDQLNILTSTLSEERATRTRFEDLLKIETTIKAIGSELDSEGHDVEYYIKKLSAESS